MLDNKTLDTLRDLVNFCNLLKSIPFKWNNKEKRVEISTSLIHKLSFSFANWTLTLNLCYLIVRLLLEIKFAKKVDFVVILWLIIWVQFYNWGFLSYCNSKTKGKEIVALFKGLKKLDAEMSSNL